MTPSRAEARAPWPVFAAVALGTFMSTLDASIVNVALPTMQDAFSASVTQVSWVALAYPLSLTLLLLPAGRLGDARGRRGVYLAGLATFVTGSLLCGLAPSAAWLVAARVAQGAGASLVSANAAAIVTAAFPAAMRGRALGGIGAAVGLGLTVGPPLGGLLVSAFGWPAIFFVNLPLGAIALVLGARVLPRDVAAVAEPPAPERPAPADGTFVAALAAIFLSFVALFAAVFLAPFYLEHVTGLPPARVGPVLAVLPLLLLVLAPLAGAASDRLGTRRLATAGLGVMAAGLVLLAVLVGRAAGRPAGAGTMIAGLFVIGLGQGLFQAPNASAAMGAVSAGRLGLAGGLVATMRNFGMVVGIALAASTYESRQAAYVALGAGATAAAGLAMRDALLVGALAALLAAALVHRARGTRTRT